MKTAKDIHDASFFEELQPIKRLMECKTIMEMKYKMADILRVVCQYVEVHKVMSNNTISERVKEFVAKNYTDPNLGVFMVGEKLRMTSSYISKLFKDQTKEGLPSYINRIRIERAAEILKDGQINVQDVAQMVGYCNSNVFIRAFKKYQGVTPGKFIETKEIS